MIALQRFLHELQVILEPLFVHEGIDVNALQLVTVLVAAPVGTGDGLDLERRAHQLLGVLHVRAAAEVDEVIARPVDRDGLVRRKILNQFLLKLLVRKDGERLLLADLLARPRLAALDDFAHLLLDGLEIVVGHGAGQQEIIIQAIRDLRADGILDVLLAEDLDDRFGQDVRQRVAVDALVKRLVLFLVHGQFLPFFSGAG